MTDDRPVAAGTPEGDAPSDRVIRLMHAEQAANLAGEAALRFRTELQSGSDAAVSQPTLQAFLNAALESLRQLLAADTVSFLVADADASSLVARTSVGLPETTSRALRIDTRAGVAGRVLSSGQPVLIGDLAPVSMVSPLLKESGARSLVAVPVMSDSATIGVLHASSKMTSFFHESDVAALTIVADRLAAAVERVQLFESERAAKERAQQTALFIAHLQRITAVLSGQFSTEETAKTVCREVAALEGGGMTGCKLWMLEDDIFVLAAPDETSEAIQGYHSIGRDEDLPIAAVGGTAEALWFPSRQILLQNFPKLDEAALTGDRFAVLPLQTGGHPFGVLSFSFDTPGDFLQHERDFLLAVADQASQGFERSRLRSIEQRLALRDAVLSRLSATLALSLDYTETLSHLLRLVVPELADLVTIHLRDESGTLRRVAAHHRSQEVDRALEALGEQTNPVIVEALNHVIDREDLLHIDLEDERSSGSLERLRPAVSIVVRPLGVRHVLLVRLTAAKGLLGVLSVGRAEDSGPFDGIDQGLFLEVARRASVAIANTRLHAQLAHSRRTEHFLLDVATALASVSGFVETLERLAAVAVPAIGDMCLIDLVSDSGELRRVVARHVAPERRADMGYLRDDRLRQLGTEHPSARVVRTGESVLASEVSDEALGRLSPNDEHLAIYKRAGWRSHLSVPLVTGHAVLGALTLVLADSGRRYLPADVELAERLATQVSVVVEQARRYDEEHRLSHVLQASLLPDDLPRLAHFDMAVRYLPGTRDAEVGGDFYDAVLLPNGLLSLTIGDVAGHDHQAAALMGRLRSAVRTLASHAGGPLEVVSSLQESWSLLGLDRMATALFCQLDPATGSLMVVNAGHPPPLLLSEKGPEYLPVRPGPPLGLAYAGTAAWHGHLRAGETIVLYTDGLIDDRNQDIFETMATVARIASSGSFEPDALCDRLVSLAGSSRSDDLALLALRAREPG